MSMERFTIATIALTLGLFVGTAVLPYHLSQQSPLAFDKLSGDYVYDDQFGTYLGRTVASTYNPVDTALLIQNLNVLGTSNKRIEVDLTNQKLYAYEGDNRIYDFSISSGKWDKTPTGTFNIWIKLRYTRMQGGSKALNTYYNLPNVPYTMYFSNNEIPTWRGFGLHGAYWHNNFGHPMSHGCVNMKPDDAKQIYYWVEPNLNGKPSIRATGENPGTPVIIYGVAPRA